MAPELHLELEGWWVDLVAQSLSKGVPALVRLIELGSRVDYLRERYKRTALQVDVEEPTDQPDNLSEYVFVKQILVLKQANSEFAMPTKFFEGERSAIEVAQRSISDPAELEKYDEGLEAS